MTTIFPTDSSVLGVTSVTDITSINAERLALANIALSGITSSQLATDAQIASAKAQVDSILAGNSPSITTSSIPTPSNIGVAQPTANYKWNLPPHEWSLPVQPNRIESEFVANHNVSHGLRRGRLWFWAGASEISTFDSTGAVTTLGQVVTAVTSAASNSNNTDASNTLKQADNDYGFQFLWNPTTIGTSVTRNMNITPSPADTLKVVAGAFPGQETITLSVVVDRINDFACIRGYSASYPSSVDYSQFSKYYTTPYPIQSNSITVNDKISKLMAQGTMADIEYLFKAVNGGYAWTNLLGKETANVGYLMPTLLGIQLGPTLDNLNYVGWITSLSLNHTNFTENMIPIRTEVSMSIDCFSGSGIRAV